ncbi:MAG: DmsC/YnfH family molybdoenzyme membrane anchor subunit [Pseudomonadota bacterium]
MHPAYSVILFTTASGAGYGLLFWMTITYAFGMLQVSPWYLLVILIVALLLITAGLLSSAAHLGHPERAHRAFSQWRSSWLSREGVAAVATYVPSGLLGLCWLFGIESTLTVWLSLLAALGAVVTVYCTGMIYASLRTIRQWDQPTVAPIYLMLGAATGALLFAVLLALASAASIWTSLLALAMLGLTAALKRQYWQKIDEDPDPVTMEDVTGLGRFGAVKPLDPPHTRPNFVMREMGYEVGRKHAEKLRRLVWLCLFGAPLVLALLALLSGPVLAAIFYLTACLSAAVGVVTERWLFFAEAEHVSMRYYKAA